MCSLAANLASMSVAITSGSSHPVRSKSSPSLKMTVHSKCRNCTYLNGPARTPVSDEQVAWSTPFPDYEPVEYVADVVAANPVWADNPADIAKIVWNQGTRKSLEGNYEVVGLRPRNPRGRTGMTERGLLGKFGPNFAADPLVSRWKRDAAGQVVKDASGTPIIEVVLIKRRDNGEWAIPGGMVDAGDSVSATLKKEFGEEAMNSLEASAEEALAIKQHIDELFKHGEQIYAGYVDDPRNTDNAWMETTCVNFHDEAGDSAGQVALQAGDDAGQVAWVEVTPGMQLYASHSDFVKSMYKLRVGKDLA
eukprot:m.356183 g.356183  ORF g.356183 m.356183 type:complete len:307 (+) comp17467_c0_seq1:756-1676(+)